MMMQMLYTSHIPQFPLSQFVDCLWHVSGQTHYIREKVLPTGTMNLIINFGSPHKVFDNTDNEKYNLCQNSWMTGLQTEYLVMEATAETNVIGVRFKPGGAYPFFDFPILELSDQIVDMDLIWGSFANEIRERLFEIDELAGKFKLFEKLLLTKLSSNLYGLDTVRFAVGEITQEDGLSTIRELSHKVGMSQKHLIHQFHKMVGVSPKLLARIFKFNHVLNRIDPAKPINWASIAYDCNYYDQAHFNKDFMAFTGLTPTTYLQLRYEFFGGSLNKGEDVNFVPIA